MHSGRYRCPIAAALFGATHPRHFLDEDPATLVSELDYSPPDHGDILVEGMTEGEATGYPEIQCMDPRNVHDSPILASKSQKKRQRRQDIYYFRRRETHN